MIAVLLGLAVGRWPLADQPSSANGQQPTVNFSVNFSMRGDRARGWPVKVRVALTSSSAQLERTIEAADARKPVALSVAPGKYRLTIAAEHHRLYTKDLDVDKDLSLPEIALSPVPAISGRVIARQKELEIPLAGAQVFAGAKQLATTNEQGLFRVELPEEPPPSEIIVMHTGQAPKKVALFENLAAENELGTIELPRGSVLTVVLDRRADIPKTLVVSVVGKQPLGKREVKPYEKEIAFPGIPPCVCQIVIKGTEPLEVMNDAVEVKDDDLEHTVVIEPFRLDGRIVVGNESLRGGGTAEIVGAGGLWRVQVPIDEEGRFGGTMWQTGKVTGWLKTALNPSPIMEVSPDLGNDPSPWNIMLKRRFIEGHVFDATTKEPVANAHLGVVITAGERRSESAADVQKDGAYSIPAVQNGRYDVSVTSADHADAKRVVLLGRDEETQTVDFPLEGGVETEVWCVWWTNEPARGARVVSPDGRVDVANADGRATLRLRAGETRWIYVVPRQGSFAFAELRTPRSGAASTVQVIVPPPAGSLRITSRLRAPVSVSYQSRELPPAVLQYLRADSEPGVMRLVHLPAGAYGAWTPGARWVQVELNSGEVPVELVPIVRRPAK